MSKTWKRNDGLKKFKSPKTKGRKNNDRPARQQDFREQQQRRD